MHDFITRSARIAGAAAILGALGFASACATDRDQLNADSGGDATGDAAIVNQDSNRDGAADIDQDASNESIGIATEFERLGMEPARAECYEDTLSEKLSPEEQQEAAELLAGASGSGEVKLAVMSGSQALIGAFSAADVNCPEGMSQ